jgi:hypothetical protein
MFKKINFLVTFLLIFTFGINAFPQKKKTDTSFIELQKRYDNPVPGNGNALGVYYDGNSDSVVQVTPDGTKTPLGGSGGGLTNSDLLSPPVDIGGTNPSQVFATNFQGQQISFPARQNANGSIPYSISTVQTVGTLNDITADVIATLPAGKTVITITFSATGPDAYDWAKTGGNGTASGTGVTATATTTLAGLVDVHFAAGTGHSIGDQFVLTFITGGTLFFEDGTLGGAVPGIGIVESDGVHMLLRDDGNGHLALTGRTDAIGLKVKANSTQTALVVSIVNSSNVNLFKVDNGGNGEFGGDMIAAGRVLAGANSYFHFNGRTALQSPVDGELTLLNAATNGFTALLFGGTDSTKAGIYTSGTTLKFRLADNSNDAIITAASASRFGSVTGDYITIGGATGNNGVRLYITGSGTGALQVANSDGTPSGVMASGLTIVTTGGSPLTTISGTTGAISTPGQITSTLATGTPPLVITSTTAVANLTLASDTQIPTISTALKVSNSATTATSANTASAIVARDISGNFTAGTITAALTGNASTATALATTRSIYGNNFDGTAALTQIIASTYGGTGNGFTKFTGATTSEKTYTLPNSSTTIVTIADTSSVTNTMLAGSIDDTKLSTISTAGKVSDSALSSNVDLLNGVQTIAAVKTFTAAPVILKDSIGTTATPGISLSNTTASTSGVTVQEAPSIDFNWHVWNTTATAADNTGAARIIVIPNSGTTPSATWRFQTNLNGAGFSNSFSIASDGSITAAGAITSGGAITVASASTLIWSGRGGFRSSGDGVYSLRDSANDAIGGLAMGNTLTARTSNLTLTFAESNNIYTNTGAGGTVNFTLPAATLGTGNASMVFHFYVAAAQSLTITAAGSDTIQDGATTSGAGGNTTASTVGNCITVRLVASGKWAITSKVGTWTTT